MITSEEFEQLPESVQAKFVKDDNGNYVPKSNDQGSNDGEDVTGLKNKNKELLGKVKQMQSQLNDKDTSHSNLQEQVDQLTAKLNNGGKDDFEALYNSITKKYEELESSHKETLKAMETKELNMTANKIAAGLTSDKYKQEMLAKEIMPRLTYKEGTAKVLDTDGNLTADSLEELSNDFANAERYAFLVDGGNGSGGNAPGSTGTTGVTPKHKNDFSSDQEMFDFIDKNPSAYDALPDQADK